MKTLSAGAPNITGEITQNDSETEPLSLADSVTTKGALSVTKITNTTGGADLQQGSNIKSIVFNASKSNAIYGSSNTIQPPALILLPQIRY